MRTKQLCMQAFLCTCCAKPEFNMEFFNKSSHTVVQNSRLPKSQVTKSLIYCGQNHGSDEFIDKTSTNTSTSASLTVNTV